MPGSRELPPFEPHPWLRSGHAQTVLGRYWPDRRVELPGTEVMLTLEDGDRLTVLETVPSSWRPGDPAALIVHGLGGCARSPFVVRLAARLGALGVRLVRVNLRNAGSSFGLARGIYHAGRSEDLRHVACWLRERAPGSPLALVGFSLGGNIVLKLAAEAAADPIEGLDCVLAANPPIDLAECSRYIRRPAGRVYDWNFVRLLRRTVRRLHAIHPDLGPARLERVRTLSEFDDAYTAPRNGFRDADDYYQQCSTAPRLKQVRIPGLILHAEDDPFIPSETFRRIQCSGNLTVELLPSGGHLGFVSRIPHEGDRRWLEARLVAWLVHHWSVRTPTRELVSQAG